MSDNNENTSSGEKVLASNKDGEVKKVRIVNSIWPAVTGGILVASLSGAAITRCSGHGDIDPGTYDPSELAVVVFSPEPGVECRGLSPNAQSQVIASTIECVYLP